MLGIKDVDTFTVGIKDGYLYWKVLLKNEKEPYQIMQIYEKYKTPAGNNSKRKLYFINKDNKKLIFSDELKKNFRSFMLPYIRDGI